MKSMQRRFGTFQKRSDDQADVGAVLAEFKAADDMIERVSLDIIAADYHSLACFP
jgi:amphiphysin